MADKDKRDIFPDILRGFAILLVVWGHCIQEGNGAEYSASMSYFDDKLYQFIYSFHMPLFALIAGYYACISISRVKDRKGIYALLGHRISVYLIPIVFWTLFEYIREQIIQTRLGIAHTTGVMVIPEILLRILKNHWFLWAMIVCFAVVWVMHFFLKDNIYIYAAIFLLMFFVPDGFNLHTYKYLLPYYLLAFYFRLYGHDESEGGAVYKRAGYVYRERRTMLLTVSGVLFAALFTLFRRRAFIYVSGYCITKDIWYIQLATDIYRFMIGLAGSIFFMTLWSIIRDRLNRYGFPVLRLFGRLSLGVYLFSGYITILVMRRFTDALPVSDLRATGETVLVAAVSLMLSYGVSMIPTVRKVIGVR